MEISSIAFSGRYPKMASIIHKAKMARSSKKLCAFTIDPRNKGNITPKKLSLYMDAFERAEASGRYSEITVL